MEIIYCFWKIKIACPQFLFLFLQIKTSKSHMVQCSISGFMPSFQKELSRIVLQIIIKYNFYKLVGRMITLLTVISKYKDCTKCRGSITKLGISLLKRHAFIKIIFPFVYICRLYNIILMYTLQMELQNMYTTATRVIS